MSCNAPSYNVTLYDSQDKNISKLFNLNEFENKLNNDEKKIILSFLDIYSLCNVNCVSKSFSLSILSNDDLFWKDHYKKIITEFYLPKTIHISYYYYYYKSQQKITKEIEEKMNSTLQSITKDYKNEIIKFVKQIFTNAEIIQKERLFKIKKHKPTNLLHKETLLKDANIILERNKKEFNDKEYSDCKMVVVGDGAVGKSCMLLVLNETVINTQNMEYIPTICDICTLNVNFEKEKFHLNMWDTYGYEDYYCGMRQSPYLNTDIFLLCFSIGNYQSFLNISERWIPELQHHCPNTPIILCGTKVDLRENKKMFYTLTKNNQVPVSKEEGEALAKKIGAIAYIETSSLEYSGFENLGQYIILLSLTEKQSKESKERKCLIQ
ncbi:hypothetical protein ABK040_007650 [Willaertia magna]